MSILSTAPWQRRGASCIRGAPQLAASEPWSGVGDHRGYVGGCRPGEESHSLMYDAVSNCLIFLRKASISGPGFSPASWASSLPFSAAIRHRAPHHARLLPGCSLPMILSLVEREALFLEASTLKYAEKDMMLAQQCEDAVSSRRRAGRRHSCSRRSRYRHPAVRRVDVLEWTW
jgi:hypothetical protein